MAFPNASAGSSVYSVVPSPPYTGVFIPELWSGKIIEKFYDATVLAAVANTDYEGEITSYGDKVTIRTKPSISINDYTAYTALTTETPSSAVVELLIDQGKYWSTALDDVMEVQSDLDHFSLWADDASEQMKIEIDTDVLAGIPAGVAAANQGATAGVQSGTSINLGVAATPVVISALTAINKIIDCGQILDENNIPETGRWIIIPAWLAAMIKTSDLDGCGAQHTVRSLSRPDVRFTADEGRDATCRKHLWHHPARIAGVWLQGCRRHSPRNPLRFKSVSQEL
jgi:hypothetical protein